MRVISPCTAALAAAIIFLLCGTGVAESPAWFSLIRPRQAFVTYTVGFGTAHWDDSYPERWSRVESRLVEYICGIRVFFYPLNTTNHALVLDAEVSQARERSTLFTWTPDGPMSVALTRDTRLVPHLRLAWQHEALTPLLRYGLEVGCTLNYASDRFSRPEASIWVARVYEPAVVSFTVAQRGQEAATVKAGVVMVLNRRLAFGTGLVCGQPGDTNGVARTSMEMAATIRRDDHTGWSLIVTWGRQTQGVMLSRNLPLR